MELCGKRLTLSSVGLEDAEAMLPAFNGDEQFNRWSGLAPTLTLEEVRADMQDTLGRPQGMVWRIAEQGGALVGVAETALLRRELGWIALLLIRREYQRQGYGAEAAALLEGYLFSAPEVAQIGLAVLTQNKPALAFWERRGYVRSEQRRDNHGNDVYRYLVSRPASNTAEGA